MRRGTAGKYALRLAGLALLLVVAFVAGMRLGTSVVSQPTDPAAVTQAGSGSTSSSGADAVSELALYPAQTDVASEDLYVYGEPVGVPATVRVDEGGAYTSRDEVALYIHLFGHVPANFISKTKARKAGWVARKGNLQDVLPGMCIGGGGWYNDDLVMPGSPDAQWFECDINYAGGYRGPERLVFSSEGLIFYTPDHYVSFARLF